MESVQELKRKVRFLATDIDLEEKRLVKVKEAPSTSWTRSYIVLLEDRIRIMHHQLSDLIDQLPDGTDVLLYGEGGSNAG